jgi:hypothetical protein
MRVETIPLTDFQHDDISAREGQPLWLEHSLALDLERGSLLRIIEQPMQRGRRAAAPASGGVRAAGEEPPSSASPAAPASEAMTVPSLAVGAIETERFAKSSRSTTRG